MQSLKEPATRTAEPELGLPHAQQTVTSRPSTAKNRGRIDVMADLLNCCRNNSSKTRIMLYANLNSIVATRMITNLSETGLLDSVHDEGSVAYVTTPRGVAFVSKYLELKAMIAPSMVPAESKISNPNRLNGLNF
jgi:predicted transcriptional regulator